MFRLKDPPPGKNRWGQALECSWSFVGLNLVLNTIVLGWIVEAPRWTRYACLGVCLVIALFFDVIGVQLRRGGPPTIQLADGTSTNPDGAAVRFHAHDRS